MALFHRNKQKTEPIVENRDNTPQESYTVPVGLSFLAPYLKGDPTQLAAFYASLEIISNQLAVVPIHIRNLSDGSINYSHPLNNIWNSGLITKFTLIKQLIWDMLLHGNGLAYIKRAADGTPIEIIYRPHGTMSIMYNEVDRKLYYLDPAISKKKIEPINVLHFIKNSKDSINGIGVPKFALKATDLAKATDKTATDFFENGANVSGILKSSKPLTMQQRMDIRNSWETIHGANKGGGIAVLSGELEYTPVGQNSEQSQMLQSREFNITEIARFFTISPTLIGDLSHTQYGSVEAAQAEFIAHTLLPLISMIQDEMNKKLLKPSEKSSFIIDLDEDHIYLSDKSSTANYLSTLTNSGIMTINEARHILNLQPVDGGDENRIPFSDVNQNTISGNQNNNDKQNGNN